MTNWILYTPLQDRSSVKFWGAIGTNTSATFSTVMFALENGKFGLTQHAGVGLVVGHPLGWFLPVELLLLCSEHLVGMSFCCCHPVCFNKANRFPLFNAGF